MAKNVAASKGQRVACPAGAPYQQSDEKALREEERALPSGPLGATFSDGFIGSIMSAAEIGLASDEDVINAFRTLPDSTEWSHPSDWEKGGKHPARSRVRVSSRRFGHGSVRFGQPAFAFTYSSAVLSISGRTLSLIGWIEGTVVFHFVPSHWTREIPP